MICLLQRLVIIELENKASHSASTATLLWWEKKMSANNSEMLTIYRFVYILIFVALSWIINKKSNSPPKYQLPKYDEKWSFYEILKYWIKCPSNSITCLFFSDMIHLCMWAKHFVIKLNMNRNINKGWCHTNCSGDNNINSRLCFDVFATWLICFALISFKTATVNFQQWSWYYFLLLSLSVFQSDWIHCCCCIGKKNILKIRIWIWIWILSSKEFSPTLKLQQ